MRKGWSSKEFSYWDMELLRHKEELMRQTIHWEALRRTEQSGDYKVALMMKFSRNLNTLENGERVLQEYERMCKQEGTVWLGSNALATGIGKKRRLELNTAISNKKRVYIYFVNGDESGDNEITYRGEVIALESRKGGMPCPESEQTLEGERHKKCSIWLKMKELAPYTEKKVADFQFVSNHKLLKDVITTNCSFGYITECGHEY